MNESSKNDYSLASNRHLWLQHPIIGSPSWVNIERESDKPLYMGKPPYEWPVNGFLFHDPLSGIWYAYIGLYPKNYWPAGGCLLLKEDPDGKWQEIGVVLEGDPNTFDGDGQIRGGMPDVSIVYDNGKYHTIYDWCNPTNSKGGIAYAWALSPEGPFHRSEKPIHLDINQRLLLKRYQRVYAATLFRREKDWLILAMMSTPGNAGGTWALVGLVGENPEGPYSEPKILLSPQSNYFHPPMAEFYPAFEDDNTLYVPATSVAKNRTFQVLFRVPKEAAMNPKQWTIFQYGGIWFDRPDRSSEQGIWGQTFSGHIYKDVKGGSKIRILSFTKRSDNIGAAILSQCPWPYQFKNGFQIASPYARASAILLPAYDEFDLAIVLQFTGPWALCWGCTNPIGPNHHGADCERNSLMATDRIQLEFNEISTSWTVYSANGKKQRTVVTSEKLIVNQKNVLKLVQKSNFFTLEIQGRVFGPFSNPAKKGRIELVPEINSVLDISDLTVLGTQKHEPIIYLANEAIIGAACESKEWKKIRHRLFRYHEGYISKSPNARAKWNVLGSNFHIHSPKHPKLGRAALIIDGEKVIEIDFSSQKGQKSMNIYSFTLPFGKHAIILESIEGSIVIDCLFAY